MLLWGYKSKSIEDLHSSIASIDKMNDWCSKNQGRSYDLERGVGSREDSKSGPPSGFETPKLVMKFYSPLRGCMPCSAAALILEGGNDCISAKNVYALTEGATTHFSDLASF